MLRQPKMTSQFRPDLSPFFLVDGTSCFACVAMKLRLQILQLSDISSDVTSELLVAMKYDALFTFSLL